ncbi:MAG: hypothetical protein LLG15_01760 [Betaproteobacteria bacterium]|nr:hypothetical protein [Betaproteobacteria bacterium]
MSDINAKSSLDVVFTAMRERCFYRVRDLAEAAAISPETARYAAHQLSRGGVIEMIKQRPMCFITKQRSFHFREDDR